jgi:hypothetical protein
MNYSPSTISRIADLVRGIQVDTGIMANLTYFNQAQHEDFNVYGRIMLLQLFWEVTTDNDTTKATLFQYNYSCATHTPAVAARVFGLVSLTIAAMTIGDRCRWTGGAVGGSNHILTGGAGYSDLTSWAAPAIVGYKDATSTIGHLTTTASQGSGAHYHSLFYVPMSDGAYVEAIR